MLVPKVKPKENPNASQRERDMQKFLEERKGNPAQLRRLVQPLPLRAGPCGSL